MKFALVLFAFLLTSAAAYASGDTLTVVSTTWEQTMSCPDDGKELIIITRTYSDGSLMQQRMERPNCDDTCWYDSVWMKPNEMKEIHFTDNGEQKE